MEYVEFGYSACIDSIARRKSGTSIFVIRPIQNIVIHYYYVLYFVVYLDY